MAHHNQLSIHLWSLLNTASCPSSTPGSSTPGSSTPRDIRFHPISSQKPPLSPQFSTFSSFSPSFPLADKKVSDFAVLYSIENQDVSVGLPIQCLKASHSLLPRASYSTFNEPILYPSYFCPPTDMENVHIRLSLFLESSSWLK